MSIEQHQNNVELDALKFIALQFTDIFEGKGSNDVLRAEDALRRAKQIMANLEPFLHQLGRQLPIFTEESLSGGWQSPNV